MECTAQTDIDGRLVQSESFVDGNGGYLFDPKDVFQGEGGGIGGRGGGRGDGTTLADIVPSSKKTGAEEVTLSLRCACLLPCITHLTQ